MSNRVWKIVLALQVALGILVGFKLAEIPNLQPYKLLNIIGLLYSLIAIFVLSEVFIDTPNWKAICVHKIAPVLLWAHTTTPIGAAFGAGLARLLNRGPSGSVIGVFAVGAFAYMNTVGFVFEQTVVLPRFFKKDIQSRWRYFGLLLLLSGIFFQLISAIKGL
jgi:hypothetical protein